MNNQKYSFKNTYGDLRIDFFDNTEIAPYVDGNYGIYSNGVVLKEGLLERNSKRAANLGKGNISEIKCSLKLEEAIYGGLLLTHYGHFIFESLARLWYSRIDEHSPIIFCSKQKYIKNFQREVFDTLGIKNPIVIAKQPIAIDRLAVPTPGARIRDYLSEYHKNFLSCYTCDEKNATRCIWLSRSRLTRFIHKVDNEEELEKIIEKNGWEIIHPQEHSINEQLQILASSKRIAGFVGSAFHTLLLLKNFVGQVTIFQRNPHKGISSCVKVSETYDTISRVKKINQIILKPSLNFITQKQSSINDFSTIIDNLNYE